MTNYANLIPQSLPLIISEPPPVGEQIIPVTRLAPYGRVELPNSHPAFMQLLPLLSRIPENPSGSNRFPIPYLIDLLYMLRDSGSHIKLSASPQCLADLFGRPQTNPLDYLPQTQPRHYQLEGARWLQAKTSWCTHGQGKLLADEMGTGKTLTTLILIYNWLIYSEIRSCWVIAPNSVKYNWVAEITRNYPHLKNIPVYLIDGVKNRREHKYNQFADSGGILIFHYELLVRDRKYLEKLLPDCVVLDEAHWVSHYTAQRTKLTTQWARKIPRRILLTGTPMQNTPQEIWTLSGIVAPPYFRKPNKFERLEKPLRKAVAVSPIWGTHDRFKQRYLQLDFWGTCEGVHPERDEELRTKLSTFMLRRERHEVLKELPKVIRPEPRWVTLSVDQREAYKKIRQQLLNDFDMIHPLAALTALQIVCDSAQVAGFPETHEPAKLTELKLLLEQLAAQPRFKVVIFSKYRRVIEWLKPQLPYNSVLITGEVSAKQRQKNVDRFTHESDLPLLLMTTAGSEGINLQAANTIVFFDLLWNPAKIAQTESRLIRRGQTESVLVIRLAARHTVEQHILDVLADKSDLAERLINNKLNRSDVRRIIVGKESGQ